MPFRQPFLKNNFYHIQNHSFESKNILKTSKDFNFFIQKIVDNIILTPEIQIFAYCLLPNQFHFIIKPQKTWHFISNFIKNIQISYTYYHKKNNPQKQITKIFPERFQSENIKDLKDLQNKINYINLAPVNQKFVKNIKDRPYSSIHQYQPTNLKTNGTSQISVYQIKI